MHYSHKLLLLAAALPFHAQAYTEVHYQLAANQPFADKVSIQTQSSTFTGNQEDNNFKLAETKEKAITLTPQAALHLGVQCGNNKIVDAAVAKMPEPDVAQES